MIKINLLKSRAVGSVATVAPSAAAAAASKNSFEEFKLDDGFSVFEYSQAGQAIKIILLVAFVAPLIVLERMRGDEALNLINSKTIEVQSIHDIKFEKEEEVNKYQGLDKKKELFRTRDAELKAVKAERLLAVKSIDEIQTAVPADVWLTGVVFDKKTIQINGQTLVDTGLDVFVKNLEEVEGFSSVNVPKDVKVKSSSGRTLNEFLVTLNVSEHLETKGEEF